MVMVDSVHRYRADLSAISTRRTGSDLISAEGRLFLCLRYDTVRGMRVGARGARRVDTAAEEVVWRDARGR
jgi:hypothetical protein